MIADVSKNYHFVAHKNAEIDYSILLKKLFCKTKKNTAFTQLVIAFYCI